MAGKTFKLKKNKNGNLEMLGFRWTMFVADVRAFNEKLAESKEGDVVLVSFLEEEPQK